jgi:hypothetical protein
VEEDVMEEDVVEKDVMEKDEVEEDLDTVGLRRSARLQKQSMGAPSSDHSLAMTNKRPGPNTSASKPATRRTRADLCEVVSAPIAT